MRHAERPSRLAAALLAAAILVASDRSGASVDGSPHDLVAQGYEAGGAREARCGRCHAPAGPKDSPVRPVPAVLAGRFGEQSLLCFSCHDGTTLVSPQVDASMTAFHPLSHGMDLTGFEEQLRTLILPVAPGPRMECVTCHDPHDDGQRPFLRAPLDKLCVLCHPGYVEQGISGKSETGNHPIGAELAGAARSNLPLVVGEGFGRDFPAPYPLSGGKPAVGVHWDLGGHLSAGDEGAVICPTCHAVHGDEAAPPVPALLSVAPVRELADRFCEGCHRGRRGDDLATPPYPNPGGTETGRTYHPADDDRSNGDGRVLDIREPDGWPFGSGTPRGVLCTSCHRAHGAWERTPLLRRPKLGRMFCEECHDRLPPTHHPTATDQTRGCAPTIPVPPYSEVRGVSCSSCHRAHNAGLGTDNERLYVPLLREAAGGLAACTACHPADNPTCQTDPDRRASHFLGDATLPGTFGDKEPPLRREPWPDSGLTSFYGGADQREIVCLTCHSFSPRAVTGGDDGTARHLIARSGNPVEWQEDKPSTYLCAGCHGTRPGTEAVRGGHTHPLMHANGSALLAPPLPPVSLTASGRMNCESCHRPHGAATAGGYYILEMVSGKSVDPGEIHPEIDFTVLCVQCHTSDKY